MKVGMGTYVADVRQIRDMFLDKEYRLQVSRQSFYEKQVECEQEVEDIFGETEGVEFRNSMKSIWDGANKRSNTFLSANIMSAVPFNSRKVGRVLP